MHENGANRDVRSFFSPQTRRRAVYRYIKKKKGYKETLTTHTHTLLRSEVGNTSTWKRR
jgi:hypothetical protein